MKYGKVKSLLAVALASATVLTSIPMQGMPVLAAEKETVEEIEESISEEVMSLETTSEAISENETEIEVTSEATALENATSEAVVTDAAEEVELESVKGKCGDDVTWRIEPSGEYTNRLIISGKGAIYDYNDYYGTPWGEVYYPITEVVIEKGITRIGNYALTHIGNINAKWTIADTVTEIGDFALQGSAGADITINAKVIGDFAFNGSKFTGFILTDKVEEIGEYAFSNTEIERIEIPSSVTKMERFAFANCDSLEYAKVDSRRVANYAFYDDKALTKVDFGSELIYIGINAFSNTGIESIKLGENVREIDDFAFYNCLNVTEITLNDKLQILGTSAFYGCKHTSITLPDSLMALRQSALGGSPSKPVEIIADNPTFYAAVTGIAYDITKDYYAWAWDGKYLYNFNIYRDMSECFEENKTSAVTGKCGPNVQYKIEDNILVISGTGPMYDYKAYNDVPWANRTTVNTVIVEDGVTSIGDWALSFIGAYAYSKKAFQNITLPDSIERIGKHAFDSGKTVSLDLQLPANLKEIDDYAFYYMQKLNSIALPAGIRYIGDYAFYNCYNLKNVTYQISDEELKLGDYAFYNCGVTTIDIPDNVTKIGISSFAENAKATGVYIGKGISEIPDGTFYNCFSLEEAIIPDNINSIGENAFRKCSKLTSIAIPGRIGTIKRYTFGSTGITNLTIGDGIKIIENNAFEYCNGLTSVTIPDSVENICYEAFQACENLEKVTLGKGVKKLGGRVFAVCRKLSDINLEEATSLEIIENEAFNTIGNTGKKIVIPASVGILDREAFSKDGFTGLDCSGTWYTLYGEKYDIYADYDNTIDEYNYTRFPRVTLYREVGDIDVYKGEFKPAQPIAATGVSLSSPNVLMLVGDSVKLTATVTPADTTDDVIWSSADESVATVSQRGVITGTGAGQTKITVTAGKKSATALVTVKAPVEKISWKEVPSSLIVGESAKAEYTVEPVGGTARNITWASSNTDVISITDTGVSNSVTINALKAGKSVISITIDGKITIEKEIEVKEYNITLNYQYEEDGIAKTEVITPVMGKQLGMLENIKPVRNGYVFLGWYTEAAAGGDTSKPLGMEVTVATYATKELANIYAYWKQINEGEIYVKPVGDYIYTGKAIKPVVTVYDGSGENLLTEKTDYTVVYKNNTNVGNAEIIVTGKGNYAGSKSVSFKIKPVDIENDEFSAADFVLAYKAKKVQKSVPALKWNGKAVPKTGYEITYVGFGSNGAFVEPGVYEIKLTGKGNFTGTRIVKETITSLTFISKASVSKIANQTYDGSPKTPEPVIKMGKETLTSGTDYELFYYNNVEAGKAVLRIVGKGKYAGMKEVNFTITGVSLAKTQIEGAKIADQSYTGLEIRPAFRLTYVAVRGASPEILTEGKDYEITGYKNNIKPGTATIMLKGIGKYAGTTKNITFKIKAYGITKDTISLKSNEVKYSKAGAKPEVTVCYNGMLLKENTDYKLSYKNNNKVGDATVTVTGKGNYAGSVSLGYKIVPVPVTDLKVVADDFIFKSGKSGYDKPKFKVYSDGKVLTAKEYSYALTYAFRTELADGSIKERGEAVAKTDKLSERTVFNLHIDVIGDNYNNSNGDNNGIDVPVYVVKETIAKATVKVRERFYTGRDVKLVADDFLDVGIRVGKTTEPLTYGVDYMIDETSYKNNIKKGTASVDIVGIGNYGLRKTITFKISSKKM